MKRILITNDDGAMAPGLSRLLKVLCPLACVTVVAPAHNQSAASSALTLDRALCVAREGTDFYTVDGTPADCVHVALTGLLAEKPDLIVAGINRGKNLGEDVVYSGTLGAARAGYLFGLGRYSEESGRTTDRGRKASYSPRAPRAARRLSSRDRLRSDCIGLCFRFTP